MLLSGAARPARLGLTRPRLRASLVPAPSLGRTDKPGAPRACPAPAGAARGPPPRPPPSPAGPAHLAQLPLHKRRGLGAPGEGALDSRAWPRSLAWAAPHVLLHPGAGLPRAAGVGVGSRRGRGFPQIPASRLPQEAPRPPSRPRSPPPDPPERHALCPHFAFEQPEAHSQAGPRSAGLGIWEHQERPSCPRVTLLLSSVEMHTSHTSWGTVECILIPLEMILPPRHPRPLASV